MEENQVEEVAVEENLQALWVEVSAAAWRVVQKLRRLRFACGQLQPEMRLLPYPWYPFDQDFCLQGPKLVLVVVYSPALILRRRR